MTHQFRRIVVLGAGGKLGRAVIAASQGSHILGVSRRGADVWVRSWHWFDRRNCQQLSQVLAQADAVIDLCCFDSATAEGLLQACPRQLPLIFASSIAEREPAYWSLPESQLGPEPADPYGQGKRAAAELLLHHWQGPLLVALLPQLVCLDDRGEQALAYLTTAAQTGQVALAGNGDQQIATLECRAVARLFAQWLANPHGQTRVQLNHPQPQTLRTLVDALMQGAELSPKIVTGARRGPHSGGDEPLYTGSMTQWQGAVTMRPLTEAFAQLGRLWKHNDFPDHPV